MQLFSSLSDFVRRWLLFPFLLTTTPVFAQALSPTPAQTIQNAISYGTVGTNILMDAVTILRSSDRTCLAKREALRVGLSIALAESLKAVITKTRPDGSDRKSFPSEHTAIAFASSGWSLTYGYAFAIGTGMERRMANKHDEIDVTAGAGIGLFSRWLGGKLVACPQP